MRCKFLLLVLCSSLVAFGATSSLKQRAADKDFLKKQQDVIHLLEQITEDIPNEHLRELGNTYDIEANLQQYEDPTVVKYYVSAVKLGYVQPKGVPFTSSISQFRKEVALLVRVLQGAKDYSTFLKTAAWARIYVNEDQFIKAFTSVVLQRQDTEDVILPPLYEIIPHYYLDTRVIQEAQNIRSRGVENPLVEQVVVIPANYTAWLPHGESRLDYFTQDIGLASYYSYVNLAGYMLPKILQKGSAHQYEPMYETDKSTNGHGSRYYYIHQQLLAHYNLERLSNYLGPVTEANYWDVHAPFKPFLRYQNGLDFPGRPDVLPLSSHQNELVKTVFILERRLIDAIDSGQVITPQGAFLSLYQPQGLNILGDLIEGTGRSINPRYYGSLQAAARQLLGAAPIVENIVNQTPSILELGQTAVRDPVFYQLFKRVISLFEQYQESLPSYHQEDILLPGVTIESVKVDKLVTFFSNYIVDLQSATALPSNKNQRENLKIKAELNRLDHKPFEYQIVVQSEKPIKDAVVRVYIGPKYDYNGHLTEISENRLNFVELDQFVFELQEGRNVIERNSRNAPGQSPDIPSIQELRQRVDDAIRSQHPFYITEPNDIYGFPERLALPKGRRNGFPLKFLVVISSIESAQQDTVLYGPVVPDEFQTYQQQHFQVVREDEYRQYVHQIPRTSGVLQDVEVLPRFWGTKETEGQVRHVPIFNKYSGKGAYSQERSVGQNEGDLQQSQRTLWTKEQREMQQYESGKYKSIHQGQWTKDESLVEYFENKSIDEIIGGAISLDGRPLGYPLERTLSPGALKVPNVKTIDVKVYHEDWKSDEITTPLGMN